MGSTRDSSTEGEPISSWWILHAARSELGYSIASCLGKECGWEAQETLVLRENQYLADGLCFHFIVVNITRKWGF